MSFDSRGVLRGSCTVCICPGYDGGQEMMKCFCGHPPGKHTNLEDQTAPASSRNAHATHHNSVGAGTPYRRCYEVQKSFLWCPISFIGTGGFYSSPTSGGAGPVRYQPQHPTYQTPSYQPHHYQHHQHVVTQAHLPQCRATGCSNPVHCDFSLPESLRTFNYCSPVCRDADLLQSERRSLTVELEDLKRVLRDAAAADMSTGKAPRQPSYERSSSFSSGLTGKVSSLASSLGVGGKFKV